jgi:hypothetical protein
MVTLQVFDPRGPIGAKIDFAPRLKTLSGKTICEISNGLWEHHRIFPLIREALKERFPDVSIVPYTEFPIGSDRIDKDEIVKLIKDQGCQAVIAGVGG